MRACVGVGVRRCMGAGVRGGGGVGLRACARARARVGASMGACVFTVGVRGCMHACICVLSCLSVYLPACLWVRVCACM